MAFAAFACYRNAGDARSHAKVAQALGKSKTLVDRWGSRHAWQDRVGAWDRLLDRSAQEDIAEARARMAREQADLGEKFEAVSLAHVEKMLETTARYRRAVAAARAAGWADEDLNARVERLEELLPAFGAYAVAHLARTGMAIRRKALGEPDKLEIEGKFTVGVSLADALKLLRERDGRAAGVAPTGAETPSPPIGTESAVPFKKRRPRKRAPAAAPKRKRTRKKKPARRRKSSK